MNNKISQNLIYIFFFNISLMHTFSELIPSNHDFYVSYDTCKFLVIVIVTFKTELIVIVIIIFFCL